jgi:Sulfotransferase domain
MTLPNFLIVGAMKCGTSTLLGYLRQHEEIYIAPREVHFFDRESQYRRGIAWYENQFHSGPRHRAIGEKTPAYCFVPEASERIYRHLPDVKLIWIFRNPVARAYSNYWHFLRRGNERASFDEAIKLALRQEKVDGKSACVYLNKGRYAEQIKNFLQFFPREQMLFLLFEDFIRNPDDMLKTVLAFLGVSTDHAINTQLRRNTGSLPRSVSLVWWSKILFKDTLPYRVIQKINKGPPTGYPPMSADIRERLQDYYRPHNRDLADLLGWDLGGWDRRPRELAMTAPLAGR